MRQIVERPAAGSRAARVAGGLTVAASALVLAGCMSSPTYGTGKSANKQLMEDVSGIMSLGDKKREPIAYAPRPELVKPASGKEANLVPPQESAIANAGAAWPEAPEARLARIKAEATANQDNPDYRSPVVMDVRAPKVAASTLTPEQQSAEFRRLRKEMNGGDSTTRKYLSEPPTTYREPEQTAAVGDVGEDEWKKDRRQKRDSRKKGGLRDLLPF